MEGAGVIAGGFLRRRIVAIVEVDFPAARAKALAYRGARQAGADDGGFSLLRGLRNRSIAGVPRDEHVALGG